MLFLGLVLTVYDLRELFRFAPVHARDVLWAFLAGVSGVLWFEAYKLLGGTEPARIRCKHRESPGPQEVTVAATFISIGEAGKASSLKLFASVPRIGLVWRLVLFGSRRWQMSAGSSLSVF